VGYHESTTPFLSHQVDRVIHRDWLCCTNRAP
jgi:hypothetical protein